MKYWLFQNNQVTGPYAREELAATAGFSAESLVCPEGRRGTQMGDWQRAGVVAELAETLLKMARVPAGALAGGDPGGSLLPPEPTLRDLAVLGTLQEKVELLENALTHLNDELRQRDDEIAALKTSLDMKGQETGELRGKLGELETKLGEASTRREQLQTELSQAREEESRHAQALEELKARVEGMSAEMLGKIESSREQLRAEIKSDEDKIREEFKAEESRLKDELNQEMGKRIADHSPAAAPSLSPAPGVFDSPAPAAPDLGLASPPESPAVPGALEPAALEAPGALEAPPSLESAPGVEPAPITAPPVSDLPQDMPAPMDAPPAEMSSPMEAPPDLGAPEAVGLDAPAPMPEAGALPETAMASGLDPMALTPPAPMGEGGAAPSPFGDAGLSDMGPMDLPAATPIPAGSEAPPDGLVDLTSAGGPSGGPAAVAQAKKKGGKKGALIFAVLLLGGGGAVGGAYMGLYKIPGLSPFLDSLKKGKGPKAAPKDETPATPAPDASAGQPDRAQEAVESAKSYVIPRTGKTLAITLEGPKPAPGLSPWNVSPIDKDRYQVSFYSKGGDGKSAEYQFEVQLEAGIIKGTNPRSQAVLNGEAPAVAPAASEAGGEKSGSAKGRKPRPRKAKAQQDLLSDPLGSMLESGEKPEVKPPAGEQPEQPAAEPGSGEQPAAEEPPAAAGNPKGAKGKKGGAKTGKSKKSKEELTLDELLLPGMSDK